MGRETLRASDRKPSLPPSNVAHAMSEDTSLHDRQALTRCGVWASRFAVDSHVTCPACREKR